MKNLGFPPPVQHLLERIVTALPPRTPAYLVGGAVRDLLCSRPTHDLDFTLPGNAIRTGRQLANALGTDFYPLDLERDTGRLILNDEVLGRLVIDVTGFRGADLENDLRDRDFTINAIAIDLRHPEQLIDPLGGAKDLQSRILRACAPRALENDPIRILRAVRLAIEFGLRIPPETTRLMRQALSGLAKVSSERLRDEIFRILDGPAPASAIRILDILGAISYVFPELPALKSVAQSPPHTLDVWDHTLATVQELGNLLNVLNWEYDPETAANWALGLVSLRLGRFRQQLHAHLERKLNPERSSASLIYLAALLHDIAKPQTIHTDPDGSIRFYNHDRVGEKISRKRGAALRLSNPEVERLASIVRFHLRPIHLASSEELPSRRAIYRFFRAAGASGVEVCLLALADTLATYGPTLPKPAWIHLVEVIRKLLEAWWELPVEIISPPVLVNGSDLLEQFDLKPGPQVGQLLEMIREAQAAGELHDRAQAFAFIRAKLDQG
jgi:putative nucleotidyltransferase with HDIG domain